MRSWFLLFWLEEINIREPGVLSVSIDDTANNTCQINNKQGIDYQEVIRRQAGTQPKLDQMECDCEGRWNPENGRRNKESGEEGSTQRKQAGLGRVGTAGRERVDIARPTMQGVGRVDDVRGRAILQDRRRKATIAGPTKARIRFGGTKIAGGRPEGREEGYHNIGYCIIAVVRVLWGQRNAALKDQRRTDIRDISKVVGQDCRRARQRHTEVRSSYHFRVGTKVNSTTEKDGAESAPGEEGVAVEGNGWRHWKEGQKLGGGAHQGQSGWSKTTGATVYQLPFIKHFETIHTGPLVSLISHGGLSVGLSLMDS
ncbi:hypothetical protein BY996DRAFT_6479507 [Phakopsora pachyrhizi]|nr:hypothetical protein BY996DRAFT_6479507 [Phakopsora pachyrhizi]